MLELVHIVLYLVTYLPPVIRFRRQKKKKGIDSLEAFITDFIFFSLHQLFSVKQSLSSSHRHLF